VVIKILSLHHRCSTQNEGVSPCPVFLFPVSNPLPAFATIIFTNVFNRINDTEIDFPAAA